jgi:hypothetical protein
MTLQNQCYCQQTPHYRAVLRFRRQLPQLCRRKVKTGDLDRPAHLVSIRIAVTRRLNLTQADSGIRPSEESIFRAAGIRCGVMSMVEKVVEILTGRERRRY